ncbi:MAG: arylamine N-acetyltransferase [Deltaproteobacteria bacterium]|nr:arylamine N-acetyltransferase [Deltaproteobacteria bacterium]
MTDEILVLEKYLERINYSGSTKATEETLRNLHICHTLNVPFENLDVFYSMPPLLDEFSLYNKIVLNRRGGYCFEMNGIFSIVLKKMGFRVTDLLARVTIDGLNYTARTHQVLLVETGNTRWLADVGFGNDGIIAPLLLDDEKGQKQFAHEYRVVKENRFNGFLLQKRAGDIFNSMYAFTIERCYPDDFVMSNHFTATFPGSFFKMMRMCTMPTKDGRITLTDTHFKVVKNGDISEKGLKNGEEFQNFLKQHFSLDLDHVKTGKE